MHTDMGLLRHSTVGVIFLKVKMTLTYYQNDSMIEAPLNLLSF